jgi:hypothetical protein
MEFICWFDANALRQTGFSNSRTDAARAFGQENSAGVEGHQNKQAQKIIRDMS